MPAEAAARLARLLNLRVGEGRTLLVTAGFLFLNTANTTVLSAVKNGLFLSVYPAELIPHAIIAAAFGTAFVAVIFTGVVAGTARRSLAVGLTATVSFAVLGGWLLFGLDARTAFVVYLLISAVQVLLMTHAWDYVSDLLTGRQAKRLLPLIGMGASLGAIAGGAGVAPAALRLGTVNLLWISVVLLGAALPLLWAVREPPREPDEDVVDLGAVRSFLAGASQGFRALRRERLLRLLGFGLVTLTLTGTLIDLQLKFLLQEAFARDRITAIYGLMSAAVGLGTLGLQFWASRVLFPRFGVSFAAMLQSGALALAAGGVALWGGLVVLAAAQTLDDILQFSLQQPVEQVSLLPFPGRVKSVTLATMGGILRPMAKAMGGGVALLLIAWPQVLPPLTILTALVALGIYTRHKRAYLAALEGALARHAVDFKSRHHGPLVTDAGALSAIERGLIDPEPQVVVFATSLLGELPAADALPRALPLLQHEAAEVRAEAAEVVGRIDPPPEAGASALLSARLDVETSPLVLSRLLATLGDLGGVEAGTVEPFLRHPDARVRQQVLVALARLGSPDAGTRLRELLHSSDPGDRAAAAGAVGDLQQTELIDELAASVEDAAARPSALRSLALLGARSVPVMSGLIDRRDLPLPLRRSVISTLGSLEGRSARDALVTLLDEPVLGAAALTSLTRMRNRGGVDPIEAARLRPILRYEIRRGLRYAVAAGAIRRQDGSSRLSFVADELDNLRERTLHRVLRILALSYDVARIDAVAGALFDDDAARRSNALELLEGTISGASGAVVMPFMEGFVEGLPEERAAELLDIASEVAARPAEALLDDPDWWPRALALHALGRDDEITIPGRAPGDEPEEPSMIPLIEKVMILKGSELFRSLPGSDLAGIAAIAEVVHVAENEVVFNHGDEGDAFYMVVQGVITIARGSHELARLGPREGFGEMAILDQETRSAGAMAAEATTLLRIDRDSFDRLIEQNPAVARGIYRVLTQRLRSTLAQVAAS